MGLCFSVGIAQAQTAYDTLLTQGREQLQAGASDKALASGQEAIKADPARWEAYALAGGALMGLKRYDEAIDDLSKAIDHAPTEKQAGLRELRKQCFQAESGVSAAPTATAPSATATQAEIVLWKTIESSGNTADFQSYLAAYPNGSFTVLAKRHLEELQQQAMAASAAKDHDELIHGTWQDPSSGLMWAKKDEGPYLNWQQATDYCKSSRLAGFTDWRLPTVKELKTIASMEKEDGRMHVRKEIAIFEDGFEWSSDVSLFTLHKGLSPDKPKGASLDQPWVCNFRNDDKHTGLPCTQVPFDSRQKFPALCTRGHNKS
jgi:hypothetical protein